MSNAGGGHQPEKWPEGRVHGRGEKGALTLAPQQVLVVVELEQAKR